MATSQQRRGSSGELAWSVLRILWWLASASVLAVGLAVTIGAVVLLYHAGGDVVGWTGDKLLANARAPIDRELPPTAYPISYAAADIQPVGGHGEILSCSINRAIEL